MTIFAPQEPAPSVSSLWSTSTALWNASLAEYQLAGEIDAFE